MAHSSALSEFSFRIGLKPCMQVDIYFPIWWTNLSPLKKYSYIIPFYLAIKDSSKL